MRNTIIAVSLFVAGAAAADTGLLGGGKMQNCPAAVPGAKVDVKESKEAVEVTITGKDEAEIRKRAQHLAEASKKDPNTMEHTGEGHGGGGMGQCVIVLKDTTISTEEVPGGAKLMVKPTRPVDFEWLKKETKLRQKGARKAKAK